MLTDCCYCSHKESLLIYEAVFVGLTVLQSCGLVTLATSSVAVATVSLNVLNAMAMPTVWTSQMRYHAVSV